MTDVTVAKAIEINKHLKALLDDVISDSRWDLTYLGMQVLIEGLALAAFALIRNSASDPLAKAINAYVMQDEARHVMFGRLALRDYYRSSPRPSATSGRTSPSRRATSCATASSAKRCGRPSGCPRR